MQARQKDVARGALVVALVAVVLFAILALGVVGCGAYRNWQRGQKRADAHNAVKITTIRIQQAQQYARIVRARNAAVNARAQQRYLEAVGIRRAQDEISKTLTPLYVQHEAIQAQERTAQSGRNSTVIYVPSGTQGVPLVSTVPPTK